jgi:hypothetical protein
LSLDANGIIMGEFGFITADDVYHVTVYATDENGNFKVISMKNIKLMKGPPPPVFVNKPKAVEPQAIAPVTTTSTTPQPFMVKTTAKPALTTERAKQGCASCSLGKTPETETISVLTTEASTEVPPPFKVVSKEENPTTDVPTTTSLAEALPQKIINQNPGNSNSRFGNNAGTSNNQVGGNNNQPGGNNNQAGGFNNQGLTTPNNRQPVLTEKLNSPQFFNKNGGNVAHYNKMENLMNGLLYRFNYTTDYQGHREEGDRLGNKDGEYFSVGRDNIKRVVSYKANEFGFMPFIKQEPLSPQELQYYDEKNNKLRYSKFEWFYPR